MKGKVAIKVTEPNAYAQELVEAATKCLNLVSGAKTSDDVRLGRKCDRFSCTSSQIYQIPL